MRYSCCLLLLLFCCCYSSMMADNGTGLHARSYAIDPETKSDFTIVVDTTSHNFENKKAISAALAFPLPFGVVGIHRIYLGTDPIIPLAYIATIGGCLGVLPFIDFVVIILADKEMMATYQKNKKMFMWVK